MVVVMVGRVQISSGRCHGGNSPGNRGHGHCVNRLGSRGHGGNSPGRGHGHGGNSPGLGNVGYSPNSRGRCHGCE